MASDGASHSSPLNIGGGSEHAPQDLLHQVLDVHGFVVISSVLTTQECHKALDLAWDWLEVASQAEALVQQQQQHQNYGSETAKSGIQKKLVSRHDPSSHSTKDGSSYFPHTVEGGIMPYYGAGHSSFAWHIRSHPNVQQVFASLYNMTSNMRGHDLLTSLDGVVLWTEPSTDCGWFHIDQNPVHKPSAAAVQGLVHLTAVNPATGGNVLVLQSHRDFDRGHFLGKDNNDLVGQTNNDDSVAAFYRDRLCEIGDDDWLEIDPNDTILLNPRRIVTVLLNAGDVLLWDSRVAHCSYPQASTSTTTTTNQSALPASTKVANQGFLRAATLVSMVPCSKISPAVSDRVMRERRHAVQAYRTLTHWVDKATPLGEERPEHVVLEMARVNFMREIQLHDDSRGNVLLAWDDLSEQQKRLVVG